MKSALERLTVVARPVEYAPRESFHSIWSQLICICREGGAVYYEIFARSPCTCDEGPWICQPCGQALRTADTAYLRGWVWRTRYSACGGIGAGLGEGNEGVECGRDGDCLVVKKVEKEIECDAAELAALEAEMEKAETEGRQWAGSSYSCHEIVGIGGKVKKKIKKKELVGAVVKEYVSLRHITRFWNTFVAYDRKGRYVLIIR